MVQLSCLILSSIRAEDDEIDDDARDRDDGVRQYL